MSISNTTFSPVPVSMGKIPTEGNRILPQFYDFSVIQAYSTDIRYILQQGKMSNVQGVFINNVGNNGSVTIFSPDLNESITVPGGYQGVYPMFCGGNTVFQITSQGSVSAFIGYMNYSPPSYLQWAGVPTNTNSATLPVSDAILDALVVAGRFNARSIEAQTTDVDHSTTITVGGTAQQLMGANPNRRGWSVQNIDETNLEEVGYSTTGVAALGSPGTFALASSGGPGYPGGFAQGTGSGTISIIAATTGHKFTAIEW